MLHRFAPLILGYALAASVLANISATSAATDARYGAGELCQQGGYLQFTPDGRRPFSDTDKCLIFATDHSGTDSLIRRARVSLTEWGSGETVVAGFTVTGLTPDRQYLATISVASYGADVSPELFTSDDAGTFAGKISTPAAPDCIGGLKILVRVTTVRGYLLGTNGTFFPC